MQMLAMFLRFLKFCLLGVKDGLARETGGKETTVET